MELSDATEKTPATQGIIPGPSDLYGSALTTTLPQAPRVLCTKVKYRSNVVGVCSCQKKLCVF
jgi:hypothetical protein